MGFAQSAIVVRTVFRPSVPSAGFLDISDIVRSRSHRGAGLGPSFRSTHFPSRADPLTLLFPLPPPPSQPNPAGDKRWSGRTLINTRWIEKVADKTRDQGRVQYLLLALGPSVTDSDSPVATVATAYWPRAQKKTSINSAYILVLQPTAKARLRVR